MSVLATCQFRLQLLAAAKAARLAGGVVKERFYRKKQVDVKIDDQDLSRSLVTDTDKECEDIIFNILRNEFPDHVLMGEESSSGKLVLENTPTWMVDPLDGTTNFVHQYPNVCVSIGLAVDRKPVVGAVYNPLTDEMFTAADGSGAFLNDRPIHVSRIKDLRNALVATSFPYPNTRTSTLKMLKPVLYGVQAIRKSGSTALDLCGVAAGRLDLYYQSRVKPWDLAAGVVLIREAGGTVSSPVGNSFDIMSGDILGGNSVIVEDMLKILAEVRSNYSTKITSEESVTS